jgi:hypothetical protein
VAALLTSGAALPGGTQVQFLSGAGSTNNGGVVIAGATTTTTRPSEEALSKSNRTTTTVQGVTTTTRKPRGSTTTSSTPGGSSTTQPHATTTTAPGTPACGRTDLVYSSKTDRTTYGPKQTVTVSLVARNTSTRTCTAPSTCGITGWASVQNTGTGATVWKNNPVAITCTNPPPAPPRLGPGQSADYPVGVWDQSVCPSGDGCGGSHAPAGSYNATAHRGTVNATPSPAFQTTG